MSKYRKGPSSITTLEKIYLNNIKIKMSKYRKGSRNMHYIAMQCNAYSLTEQYNYSGKYKYIKMILKYRKGPSSITTLEKI